MTYVFHDNLAARYHYQVSAVNAAGEGERSDSVWQLKDGSKSTNTIGWWENLQEKTGKPSFLVKIFPTKQIRWTQIIPKMACFRVCQALRRWFVHLCQTGPCISIQKYHDFVHVHLLYVISKLGWIPCWIAWYNLYRCNHGRMLLHGYQLGCPMTRGDHGGNWVLAVCLWASIAIWKWINMQDHTKQLFCIFLLIFGILHQFSWTHFFFDPSQAVFDLEVDAWLLPHVRLPWLSWHVCCWLNHTKSLKTYGILMDLDLFPHSQQKGLVISLKSRYFNTTSI